MSLIAPSQLPIEVYHGAEGVPRWWSKSSLLKYKEMGAPWTKLWIDKKVVTERPDGALQGLALDCALTEREEFASRFVVRPQGIDLRTKDGKAWAADQGDRDLLSANDGMILNDAVAAVQSCCVWDMIEKSLAQHTIRRDQPALGIGLQSRPDWIYPAQGIVLDLKKTRDLTRFPAQAIDLGYHLQAALAAWCALDHGITIEKAYLVAVEWERGARCRVLEIPGEYLVAGHEEMVRLAREVGSRLSSNDWTDVQPAPEMLKAPRYSEIKAGVDHG
jgi:hypothetical protein